MADLEKLVDEISSLTLLEAAQLKTMLEERLGVQAAMPMAAMPMAMAMSAAPAEAAAEKTEFNVTLTSAGPKKIQVIKAVRTIIAGLSLQDAKQLVEAAPSPVLQGVPKEAAEDAKAKLEAEGASVEIS